MTMIWQGLRHVIELHHEEFVISGCNKIQPDDLPCHLKICSGVIYSFAQHVLRSQGVPYTAFSCRYEYTPLFHIQNWVGGCVFKYRFFFFHFNVILGSLSPKWNYLFSSPLLPLFIALQFFPCSRNLSVMIHLFCFLLFLYLGIKVCPGVRAEGWEVGGWSLFLF